MPGLQSIPHPGPIGRPATPVGPMPPARPAPPDRWSGVAPNRRWRERARDRSKWHVPVLAFRQVLTLGGEEGQALDQYLTGLGRIDDVVDVSPLGGRIRVGVALGVLLD